METERRCSSTMEMEGLSEEEMINSLFYRCDVHNKGKVQISTVIQFLKNCLGNGNNEPDLDELEAILEEEGNEGNISFTAYRNGVKQWIAEIRQRCESTSFLESDELIMDNSDRDIMRPTQCPVGLSGCIETSGIGDGPFRNDQDIGDFLSQLEDVKYQNRKLVEENTKLNLQLEAQEEAASVLASELQVRRQEEEQLKKKVKSLQELVDFRQVVVEENEELKTKTSRLKERKKELENKVVLLEREKTNLENQTRSLENKWQRAQQELEHTKKELLDLQNNCAEHKHVLFQTQELKNSKETQLTEKCAELSELKEKFQELVESNEKLEEERDHLQTVLSDTQGKLLRIQNCGGGENSCSNGDGVQTETRKVSPKHGYSTPLTRNSICMELKDRLDESKHLPSPLCEKLEFSKDLSVFTRPTVLTPYMSAWELDITNGSVPDYSLELLKSRRGMNSGVYDVDIEKKILGLKNLEKDALHKEIIKLYRLNVELSEKCHKAEVREEELREMVNQSSKTVDLDKQNIHRLEECLQTSQLAREIDLKDLWRIVQVDVEKETFDSQSDSSEFGSSEYLKHQITQEIETLKNRLHKREAALGALSCTRGKVTFAKCKGDSSSSPLVDALAIDLPENKKRYQNRRSCHDQTPCKDCQRSSKCHPAHCSKSVPLTRRNNRIHDIRHHLNISSSSSTSGIGDLECNNSSVLHVNNKLIPRMKFPSDDTESQTSQSIESNTTDNDIPAKPVIPIIRVEMDETKTDSLNPLGHVTNEGQILRRPSYTTAISNETSSVEDVHIPRSRSYSFQTAIEQGQISPTGPPQMTSTSSVEDSTQENESRESSWNSVPPRFSSTPLPESKPPTKAIVFHPHTVKPYTSHNTSVPGTDIQKQSNVNGVQDGNITENGEPVNKTHKLKESQDKDPCKSISISLQSELMKTGPVNENKSLCSSNHLSILLEEDAYGTSDSSPRSCPALSATGIQPAQHISSFLGSSGGLGSAEFWTLSRSSTRQTDSGHSSSLTSSSSFQQKMTDISDVSKSSETERTGSSSSSPKILGSSVSSRPTSSSSMSAKLSSPSASPKSSSKLPNPVVSQNSLISTKSSNYTPSTPPRTSVSSSLSSPVRLNSSPASKLRKPSSPKLVSESCKTVHSPVSSKCKEMLTIPLANSPQQKSNSTSVYRESLIIPSPNSPKQEHNSTSMYRESLLIPSPNSPKQENNSSSSYRKSMSIPSPNSPEQESISTRDHVSSSSVCKPVINSAKFTNVSIVAPSSKSVNSNSIGLSVVETFAPTRATTFLVSSSSQKASVSAPVPKVEHCSTFKEGDSELLADLTNSLSCMTLDSPPKVSSDTEKDSSTTQNGGLESQKLPDQSSEVEKSVPSSSKDTATKEEQLFSRNSGNMQNTPILSKGGDIRSLRDNVRDIQEMVKDSPSFSGGSMSLGSSTSSKLSSVDSRFSSVSTSSSSDKTTTVTNNNNYKPRRQTQIIIEDDDDGIQRDEHKVESSLSKLRETHLARRRDQLRTRMPQLSELSEKDGAALQNGLAEVDEKVEVIEPPPPNDDPVMPSVPDEFLSKLGLTQDDPGTDELSDQEIESKFTSLSLAFKTDSQTLEKRLEIQERSRDIAEQNVDKELLGLRTGLATLNQICTDPQVREVLTKIQNHIDILEKSTARVSSRAEVLGAIQQEKRMSKAVDIMVHHVENLRRVHEREHAELEEARKLLQDSRSLGPTSMDLSGNERMLSRRSASVCPNNILPGQSSRRRVSEIALPKVLGGSGAPNLHLSSSMDSPISPDIKPQRSHSPLRMENSIEDDEDAKSRFQAVVASTAFKTNIANTLRRASLERQNPVQQSPTSTPDISRNNSQDKTADTQDKEKQKNLEEEAFKKGYEQGMRASLGQDLSSLREHQNQINQSLGDIMDSIDNQMEEPKSLKEVLLARADSLVPKVKLSGWRIRMTFGCFFIVMAIISVIVSLFPVGSATLVGFRHYGRPPL